MKALIISLYGNTEEKPDAFRCYNSVQKYASGLTPVFFVAVSPEMVDGLLQKHKIFWAYPWDKEQYDFKSGLKLTPYKTAMPYKRVACFLSHYLIWKEVAETNEPCVVLEEDAIFTQDFSEFEQQYLLNHPAAIIGLNDPRGATRKSNVFYNEVIAARDATKDLVAYCPQIDDNEIPQGLAGNSAYIIKPTGAKKLLELVDEYGAWPNDAIMCRQLLPKMLYVTTKFYTRVQGTKSTTTL